MKTLRKFIQLVLKEDKELLKKWSSKSGFEQLLLQFDIVPIPRGEGSSFIGEGMYQKAFEVIWKNKRAVAKFSKKNEDIDAVLDLDAIKKDLPLKMRKHVLRVYDFKDTEDTKSSWSFVVVEYLNPLPENVIRDLWGHFLEPGTDPYAKERATGIERKDIEDIVRFSMEKFIPRGPAKTSMMASKATMKKFVDVIQSAATNFKDYGGSGNIMYDDDSKTEITKMIIDTLNEFGVEYKHDLKIVVKLYNGMMGSVTNLLNRAIFPDKKDEPGWMKKKILRHPNKKIREFMRFLMYLSEEKGIAWQDLHDENVMVRPKTGDLVLSDPGLFQFY